MPREIDCPDCDGKCIIDCPSCKGLDYTMSNCDNPDCIGGEIMCLRCDENGKIKVFIQAELNKAVQDAYKTCTSICEGISRKHWADYKRGKNRADLHYQGLSMGAEECEEAIKKRSTK